MSRMITFYLAYKQQLYFNTLIPLFWYNLPVDHLCYKIFDFTHVETPIRVSESQIMKLSVMEQSPFLMEIF